MICSTHASRSGVEAAPCDRVVQNPSATVVPPTKVAQVAPICAKRRVQAPSGHVPFQADTATLPPAASELRAGSRSRFRATARLRRACGLPSGVRRVRSSRDTPRGPSRQRYVKGSLRRPITPSPHPRLRGSGRLAHDFADDVGHRHLRDAGAACGARAERTIVVGVGPNRDDGRVVGEQRVDTHDLANAAVGQAEPSRPNGRFRRTASCVSGGFAPSAQRLCSTRSKLQPRSYPPVRSRGAEQPKAASTARVPTGCSISVALTSVRRQPRPTAAQS